MRLICLVDNSVQASSALWGEHGLSFLIETDGGKVLWDTGQSGTVLAHNLEILGLTSISLAAIALSHAHYDHTGGLETALKFFPGTPIYAHPGLFQERYSQGAKGMRPIGLQCRAEDLQQRCELHLSDDPQEIVPGVWTSGGIHHRPFLQGASVRHFVRQGEGFGPDRYEDDMSLILRTGDSFVLLAGCCHAGLRNTVETAHKVYLDRMSAVVGGTHLADVTLGELSGIITMLEREKTSALYLNHCTGEGALFDLRERLGMRVHPCPAGTIIEF